jgi:hypothetical protein
MDTYIRIYIHTYVYTYIQYTADSNSTNSTPHHRTWSVSALRKSELLSRPASKKQARTRRLLISRRRRRWMMTEGTRART